MNMSIILAPITGGVRCSTGPGTGGGDVCASVRTKQKAQQKPDRVGARPMLTNG